MSTTPQNLLQLARQGNPDAIAALMNQHLQARGITAQVTQQGDALSVLLESSQPLSQHDLVAYVEKGIKGLSLSDIHHLSVSGKQTGHTFADWEETIAFPGEAGVPLGSPLNGDIPDPAVALADELGFDSAVMNGQDIASSDLDLDLDLGNFDDPSSSSELDLGLDASFDAAVTDDLLDLGLDASDVDPNDISLGDLDLNLADTPESAQDFTFDLGINDLPGATDDLDAALSDLDLSATEAEASWTDTSPTDTELDLGFDHDPSRDELDLSLDTDLGLADTEPAPLIGLEEFDLGLDENPSTPAPAFELDSSDLDFDFAETGPPLENHELDLMLNSSPETAASPDFDLDLGGSPEDLGGTEAVDSSFGSELDLDFEGIADSPGSPPSDLDLGTDLGLAGEDLPQGNVDFDLGQSLDLEDIALPPTETEGDFNLDSDLGLENLDIPQGNVDFDLGQSLDLESTRLPEAGEAFDPGLAPDESGEPPLSLGDGLEGDLWEGATANPSFYDATPAPSWPQTDTDDIEWDVEETLEFPTPEDNLTNISGDVPADIVWDSLDLSDASPESEAEVAIPAFEDGDTAPDFDLANPDMIEVPPSPPRDGGPVDLMLSEDLALSLEDDNEPDGLNLLIEDEDFDDGTFLQTGEFAADEVESAISEETDTNLGFAVATPPPSPVHKLLSEDDFNSEFYSDKSAKISDSEAFGTILGEDQLAVDELEDMDPNAGFEEEAVPAFDPNAVFEEESSAAFDPNAGFEEEAVPVFDPNAVFEEESSAAFDPSVVFDEPSPPVDAAPFLDTSEFLEEDDITVDSSTFLDDEELTEQPPEFSADAEFAEEFDLEAEESPIVLEAEEFLADDLTPLTDPEPGLRPEDFPLFEQAQDAFVDQTELQAEINQAELGQWSAAGETADFDVSEFAVPDEEDYDVDTLQLDTGSEGSSSRVGRFYTPAAEEDEFSLNPVEDFDDTQPLESLSAESAATAPDRSREEFDFSEDVANANLGNGFVSDVDVDWNTPDEPDATDEFIHEVVDSPDQPISTSVNLTEEDLDSLDSSSSGSSSNWLVFLGLGVVGLGLAAILANALLGNLRRQPAEPVAEPPVEAPAPVAEETEAPSAEAPPAAEPEATTPPPEPPAVTPPAEVQYFREAVNAAQNAANLTQTASTKAEWQAVADSWARSIDLMKQVPESDPNYAVAQQKAVEYQPNLNYAQQNADRL